jgi:phosphoglycerate dehydrogenase-like enzyme
VSSEIEVACASNLEGAIAAAAEVEVIQTGAWSDALLRAAPKLKWVQNGGAGVERFMTPEFIASPVILTNAQGVYAVPIADHVLAFVLHFARCFGDFGRAQQQSHWAGWDECAPDELCERTLGIIGLGGIGSEVAKRAKGFGMRVIATRRRSEKASDYAAEVRGDGELEWLLAESDYVAICAPLTPQTRHLIGEEQLRRMKPTACIINIARGGLIDQRALATALREGVIAGAGLDVFEQEPLPEDSPLWALPNVMITPHTAGSSPRSHARFMALFCGNLRRYLAGEPLLNVVNKVEGY